MLIKLGRELFVNFEVPVSNTIHNVNFRKHMSSCSVYSTDDNVEHGCHFMFDG